MRTKLYWIAALPLAFLAFACNNGNSSSATADSATAKLERTGEDIKTAANNAAADVKQAGDTAMSRMKNTMSGNPDSAFVAKTTMKNQHEIVMLQAGVKMGTNKQLKEHAKMMLADHTKLAKKLEAYASSKHYSAIEKGNEKAADDMDDMKGKTGADWDKAWLNKMIDGHKDNISAFESARNDVKDSELKSLIDNTLPTLHHHLDMVTSLRDNMK